MFQNVLHLRGVKNLWTLGSLTHTHTHCLQLSRQGSGRKRDRERKKFLADRQRGVVTRLQKRSRPALGLQSAPEGPGRTEWRERERERAATCQVVSVHLVSSSNFCGAAEAAVLWSPCQRTGLSRP